MPTLSVSDVNKDIPMSTEKYIIKTLRDVSMNEEWLKKLTNLVKNNYEKTHLVNPVVGVDIKKWEKLILADDIILDGSIIYIDQDKKDVIAYSFLHQSEKSDTYELGWCGVEDNYNRELITQLTFHQICYAADHGVQYIVGEFDTTDHNAMEVLKTLPFQPSPTLITYQKSNLD
ncbi:hypothetical protein SAMN05216362_1642 [Piscibacillus halophilus]|uniref:Uncharacterized protein n=3 Tax=Piscibacillus halophilus TaxID=571933 RepID=A0A1H9MJC9_9BACI|nr:hypothetical protein SAMN05216362_1642 [Piscibacillus halophilus]